VALFESFGEGGFVGAAGSAVNDDDAFRPSRRERARRVGRGECGMDSRTECDDRNCEKAKRWPSEASRNRKAHRFPANSFSEFRKTQASIAETISAPKNRSRRSIVGRFDLPGPCLVTADSGSQRFFRFFSTGGPRLSSLRFRLGAEFAASLRRPLNQDDVTFGDLLWFATRAIGTENSRDSSKASLPNNT
jgi:hypothetical protein